MKSGIFQRGFFALAIVIVSCDSLALELVPSQEGQEAYQRFVNRATKLAAAEASQNSGSPINNRGRVPPPEVPSQEGQEAYQRFVNSATKLAAAEASQNSGSLSNLRGRVPPPEVPSQEGQEAYQRFVNRATKLAAAEASQNSGSSSVLPPEKFVPTALPHTDQVIFGDNDQVQKEIPLGFNKIPKTTYRPQPSSTAPLHKEFEIPILQLPAQPADAPPNGPETSERNQRKFEVPSGRLPAETSNPPPEKHYHDEYEIANLQLPNDPTTANKPQGAVSSEEEFVISNVKVPIERTVTTAQAGKQYDKAFEIANLELPPPASDQKEQKKPSNVYLTPNTPLPTHRIEGTRYTPEHVPPKTIPYSEYKPPATSSQASSSLGTPSYSSPDESKGSPENPSISSSSYSSQPRPSSTVPFPRVISRVIFPTTSSSTSLPPTYNTNSYTTPAPSYKTSVLEPGTPSLPVTEIRHVITYVLPPSYGNPLGLQPDHQQLKSDIESSIKDLFQPFGPTYYKRIYTTQLIK